MVSAGNHEASDSYDHYMNRFNMPSKSKTKNLYYSFDINNVHFVSIVSEMGVGSSYFSKKDLEKFKDWFAKDMEGSDSKWKVAYFHRPLYCSDEEGSMKHRCVNEAKQLRTFFEDLFYKYHVDLVIAGHNHLYERMYPLYQQKVDQKAVSDDKKTYTNTKYPTYLICGSGGNREGQYEYKPASYAAVVLNNVGVCELTFTKDSLSSKFVDSGTSEVVDSFTIIKN